MTMVVALVPGCRSETGAVYVAQTQHPLWPHLQLVIWKLEDGTWSHDALSPAQDVGRIEPFTLDQLKDNLRTALLGERTSPRRPRGTQRIEL